MYFIIGRILSKRIYIIIKNKFWSIRFAPKNQKPTTCFACLTATSKSERDDRPEYL
mgnify:CR=1 FL=1